MQKLTEQERKEKRNKKDRERLASNPKSKALAKHRQYKSICRTFLTELIREEEKEEFRQLLKDL